MTTGYLPAPYVVRSRRQETHDTVTLTLSPAGDPLARFRPGQFTMMYAFGVGDIPVSISGSDGVALTQTVRAVGAVSAALVGAATGQPIGLRGPFGTCWSEADAQGQDLLVIAGGIGLAPLRAAVLSALAERDRYRRIVVLVGARSPAELVFAAELDQWRTRGADVSVSVDKAETGWEGHVGVVTQLLGPARIDAAHTLALICGPEVMMRITARALLAVGLAPERIRVSLERNMQCGIALCGHCQLGPLLMCRDGPVLGFSTAEPLLAIQEL